MRLTLLLCILFLFASNSDAKEKNLDNSLIWMVSGNGLQQPSFLFGTIHLICPQDYIWTKKMKKSFNAAKVVCFEMDLDDRNTMLAAAAGFIDTGNKTLKDYFTSAQYKKLYKFVRDSIGIDINMLPQMKPIALESLISMHVTDCGHAISYEDSIMRMALKAKKHIEGLETPDQQLMALNSIPSDSVVSELLADVDNFNQTKAEFKQLIATYRSQNLQELYNMITGSKGIGQDKSVLLDDRNVQWISKMQQMMQQNPTFFAVGAGHLWGDKGLITLLRSKGYTVEPVQ